MGKEHQVELVRRFGGANSDAVLEPTMECFSIPEVAGFVSYRLKHGFAICYGEPICAAEHRNQLTHAFHQFAEQAGFRLIYVSVSEEFAKWAAAEMGSSAIEFGKELVFTPPCDLKKLSGPHASLVRRKVKHAKAEGVTACEHRSEDTAMERLIEGVGEVWLKSRRGPQMHISNVHLFQNRMGKRWFYAKKEDQVIGTISLNQIQAHGGWLINHLMVVPNAPHGTSELLFTTVLEELEKQGCPHATVGTIPAGTLGQIIGLNRFSKYLARFVFYLATKVLKLHGLDGFWRKFHPQSKPVYLLFSRHQLGLRAVVRILRGLSQ